MKPTFPSFLLLELGFLLFCSVWPVNESQAWGSYGSLYGERTASWDTVRPPAYYSTADSWISEELLPKEKSLIHVKLIKPLPKEIPIWELRNRDSYLRDLSLDFESPYKTVSVNNCIVDYKSYFDGYTDLPNNEDIIAQAGNIQVQISGSRCLRLPLEILTPLAENVTHLVVRDTGVHNLTKYSFGAARLDRILRLDLIGNQELRRVEGRAFDGLTRLQYLSMINNEAIDHLDLEAFAGIKTVDELIYIGNGVTWDSNAFVGILKAASARILPHLIHLHLCGSTVGINRPMTSSTGYERSNQKPLYRDYYQPSTGSSQETKSASAAPVASPSVATLISEAKYVRSVSAEGSRQWTESGIKVNKNDLSFVSQVKYLQLSDCDITSLHPLAFAPLIKNLKGLNLGGNARINLKSVKRSLTVFYDYHQPVANDEVRNITGRLPRTGLEKLDLSASITTKFIPKDLLVVISKTTISELYFERIQWKAIRVGDLPPMPRLKVLHMDFSQIEYIEEGAFIGFDQLNKLSIRANMLLEIPLNLLEPLTKLQFLDLSGYKKSDLKGKVLMPLHIPQKFFIHGTNLKEINLSYKDLDPLPRAFFLGLFKAEKVHLRGCGLRFIEYLTFFPLKSIAYVDLSENEELISSIRETHEDTFVGLEAVQMIRMSSCNITSKDINDFNIFRRIQEHVRLLDLSHNQIEKISRTTFENFTELRHLDLSHNRIRSWTNFTLFSRNNFMTTLDISANRITHISPEMLGDFRRLKNLSFAFNPLECNCLWKGPLLLLNQKQAKHILTRNFQEQIEQQLQSLVHRQHQIVSEAFSSPAQAPPKSIIDWMNTTTLHFIRDRHPLRSNGHYFCHTMSADSEKQVVVFKRFFGETCSLKKSSKTKVSFALLTIVATVLLLFTVIILVIAFVYHSTLRTLFNMVDDDFLHNYQYDAFVSYNVNDSDWVFKQLVPNLEDCSHEQPDPENGSDLKSEFKTRIKLCVYDRDFIAGRPISECITESIKTSRKVILVISNNFIQSPWCRFETDLAHNTLMDQNREGLILVKLEEISGEALEKEAPQLHFLLKTRIYLQWSYETKEQNMFWKKLHRALGFTSTGPYGTVKQYYKNFAHGARADRKQERRPSVVLAPAKEKDERKKQIQAECLPLQCDHNNAVSSSDALNGSAVTTSLTKDSVCLYLEEDQDKVIISSHNIVMYCSDCDEKAKDMHSERAEHIVKRAKELIDVKENINRKKEEKRVSNRSKDMKEIIIYIKESGSGGDGETETEEDVEEKVSIETTRSQYWSETETKSIKSSSSSQEENDLVVESSHRATSYSESSLTIDQEEVAEKEEEKEEKESTSASICTEKEKERKETNEELSEDKSQNGSEGKICDDGHEENDLNKREGIQEEEEASPEGLLSSQTRNRGEDIQDNVKVKNGEEEDDKHLKLGNREERGEEISCHKAAERMQKEEDVISSKESTGKERKVRKRRKKAKGRKNRGKQVTAEAAAT